MIKTLGSMACVLAICLLAGAALAEEPAIPEEMFNSDTPFFVSQSGDESTPFEKFALQTFMERRDMAISTSPVPKVCAVSEVYALKAPNNAGEFLHLVQTAQSTCGDCSACLSAASCLGCLIGGSCGKNKTCNVVGCPPPAAKACCGCS